MPGLCKRPSQLPQNDSLLIIPPERAINQAGVGQAWFGTRSTLGLNWSIRNVTGVSSVMKALSEAAQALNSALL
ncbi:hypothetical protein SRHO_G00135030 [Serrasalmus rhombeus]